MAYSDYLNYIENLKNDFIKTYNNPYTGDEYFRVAIKTWYDDYDGYEQKGIINALELCIKTGTYTETFKNRKGVVKTIVKQITGKKAIGVWAVKKADGIHEMVTGMKIYPIPSENHLCCCGIEPIKDKEIIALAEDIQYLDSNINYKNQYIRHLNAVVADNWKNYFEREKIKEEARQRPIIEAQKQEAAKQFLKAYKLPNNN